MSSNKGKHLLNSLETAVAENLLGYARQHSQLQVVPGLNVIISKSALNPVSKSRKVAIVSGAGSGHEPVMHGFVGSGGLDASVAGQVFASPSTGQIFETLRLLSSHYNEILLVVNNYTGDRLNFGLAGERAKVELSVRCKLFCFGDDVAFDQVKHAKTGRRGLAGGTLLSKCLGSLAEKGLGLDELYESAAWLASRIATMSVSLTACDVPGSGTSFVLADNELELGLGIHGEPGIRRTFTLLPCREVVEIMIESIVSSLRPGENARVALLINNTGGLSNFDLNIVANDAIQEVKNNGMLIDRLLVGSYCTSFSMTGVSLSIMLVDDDICALLDEPNDAPLFNPFPVLKLNPDPVYEYKAPEHEFNSDWIEVPGVCREEFRRMVNAAAWSMIDAEEMLNDLDRFGGDADCGLTAKKGASAILHHMKSGSIPSFLDLAVILSQEMGGTSGAIYSLLFTSVHSAIVSLDGKNFTEKKDLIQFWSETLAQAIRTVSIYSWAEPGDRTMLDTVFAVQKALQNCRHQSNVMTQVADAAEAGAQETASLKSRAGRSSYASETTIGNQPDAGAVGVATWISAAVQALNE